MNGFRMLAYALPICLLPLAGTAQATSRSEREMAGKVLVEAGGLAAACRDSKFGFDETVVASMVLASGFVESEIAGLRSRMRARALVLDRLPQDQICRDMIERYGPDGEVARGLLIPRK